jgi:hypothetical protein
MGGPGSGRDRSIQNGLMYGSGCSRHPSCFTCTLKDCRESKIATYNQKKEIPKEALEFQRQAKGLINDIFDPERTSSQPYNIKRGIAAGYFAD